nr:formyltransferase family protein [Clostridium beijerinckii]
MNNKKESCIIMGLGPLCILCSEYIFKNSNIEITGLISADESVINWGKENRIRTLFIKNKVKYSLSQLEIDEFVKEYKVDYFFSIINAMFLPEWIIKSPRKYAINFHDSELPKYAGIDTNSWVIMLKEKNHAVTWHLMSKSIDEGDIIKQVLIPIDKDETAFTLNKKGFEAGLSSFIELVEDLSLDRVVLRKQLIDNRSYFSRSKPYLHEMSIWNHGIIFWKNSAEDIYALVRALDYGPDRNALGTSKMVIDNCYYIIPRIEICDTKSNFEPGTVLYIDEKSIIISTSTNDVLLNDILDIDGATVSIEELIDRHNIKVNSKLDEVSSITISRIKELDKDIMWKEGYWAEKISHYQPLQIPCMKKNNIKTKTSENLIKKIYMSEKMQKDLINICKDYKFDLCSFLFSCFSSFLALISEQKSFHIWYSDNKIHEDLYEIGNLFSNFVLYDIFYDKNNNFMNFYKSIEEQRINLKNKKYFLWDIFYRYPQLINNKLTSSEMRQFSYVFKMEENEINADISLSINSFDLSLIVNYFDNKVSLEIKYFDNLYENITSFCQEFSLYMENILLSIEKNIKDMEITCII